MVESFDNYQLDFHFLFQSEEMYILLNVSLIDEELCSSVFQKNDYNL